MCNPVAIVGAVGLVISLAGTVQTVQAQRQASKQATQAGRYNARVQDLRAGAVVIGARQREVALRARTRALAANIRTRAGGSGIFTTEGNPLALQEQVFAFGELDALMIRNNADREAYFIRIGADIDLYQGEVARSLSEDRARATALSGVSGLVSGTASLLQPRGALTFPSQPDTSFDPIAGQDPNFG